MGRRPLCGKKYGTRRQLTCKRHAGHPGNHATRRSVWEMRTDAGIRR